MKIEPKTIREAREIVYNVLIQGDKRYNDSEREITLSLFMINNAISLEKKKYLK